MMQPAKHSRPPLRLFPDRRSARLYDRVVQALRVRHYSRRTEQAYVQWLGPQVSPGESRLVLAIRVSAGASLDRREERFADLLAGRARLVDLSNASAAEMCELLQVAESARGSIKRPSKWEEPTAALEFITAYDQFLNLLRKDKRVEKK